ncbi:hypothetical protein [Corynebacterium rouxii]|uniref:Uncharacterized protein n=1 Tax=Corynebacterium rouxii TaxID=2719119 RepID=A0ABU3PJG4_9CORY|nr:hypothetical protein [Corynebacterium rouxii]MDT9407799.1 hypothetical protein [Corynebacterium rouxii]MDT9409981.1 hypothetical protein [Corynebacterium rouxii]
MESATLMIGVVVVEAIPYNEFHGVAPALDVSTDAEICEALVRIIEVEGPVLGRRLLEVYARAAGHKLGRRIRERLVAVMKAPEFSRSVVWEDPLNRNSVMMSTMYLKDTPSSVIRAIGPRDFPSIPPNEIKSLMMQLLHDDYDVTRGVLYKRVLRFYDRGGKITNNVRVVLDPVYDLIIKEQA